MRSRLRSIFRLASIFAAITLAVLACSSSSPAPTSASCPADEPRPGTACTSEDARCDYATSTHVDCQTDEVVCTRGTWTLTSQQGNADACDGG